MVEVPGEGGQAPGQRVNDGVLHDVDGAGEVGGEHLLGPSRQAVGLGEEPSGEELVVGSDLPVDHVLRQHMSAAGDTGHISAHIGIFDLYAVLNQSGCLQGATRTPFVGKIISAIL